MQPPVGDICGQLARWERQAANEEDKGYGAVDDAVFTPDGTPMCSNPLAMLVKDHVR